jgi:hypothetical protein
VYAGSGNPTEYEDIGTTSGYEGTLTISGGARVFLKNNSCDTPVTTTHENETFPAGTTEVYGEAISVPDTWTGGFGAWLRPCTLSCDANGGSGSLTVTRLYGATASVPDGSGLSRTGYMFSGWNTATDGGGTNYAAGSGFTFSADLTLYAHWFGPGYIGTVTDTVNSNITWEYLLLTSGTCEITNYIDSGSIKSTSVTVPGSLTIRGKKYAVTQLGEIDGNYTPHQGAPEVS